jgi:hypothetical protein
MAGFATTTNEHLIRSNLWSAQIKDIFEDELLGMNHVDWITDFPDGDTINIPSIGQAEVRDYEEGQAIRYTAMDTGNFTFTINEYKSSATFVYDKYKQDSFYMGRVEQMFVPKQARAIAKAMEVDLLARGPDGQTASNLNAINGASHRWVGSGTNEVIDVKDFALASYALRKANVPMTNLIAIVDPSVAYKLETSTNLINLTNNPQWEGVIRDGAMSGTKFRFNVFGWDVYTSQNLKQGIAETINGKSVTTGVANIFFSAASEALPIVGHIRQAPRVESKRNIDFQRDEYVTTCRYDFKLFRPENFITVLTDTDQVS